MIAARTCRTTSRSSSCPRSSTARAPTRTGPFGRAQAQVRQFLARDLRERPEPRLPRGALDLRRVQSGGRQERRRLAQGSRRHHLKRPGGREDRWSEARPRHANDIFDSKLKCPSEAAVATAPAKGRSSSSARATSDRAQGDRRAVLAALLAGRACSLSPVHARKRKVT